MAESAEWYATGRRKGASARVRVRMGSGKIIINNLPVDEYFGRPTSVMVLMQPLQETDSNEKFDIIVNVKGGGKSGQAGAIRLGISRAISQLDAKPIPLYLLIPNFL